ncbi:PREDICTED: uncharacterized protein LOC106323372 [Brassica oleracea var. oleracea]|uniref:uncharacterized protein LOC106323372 n=1 Tax=Brassica oleracea var. oleracea TaxID=109376 RepID=UPI0006A6D043|nr:PREDICTED: uncharacterized protein LOC106323372 [Brassica oleracea var. oleracea]
MRMKITLKVHKVWEAVEDVTTNREKNDMALALLFQSIPETLILQAGELDKAKQVWEAIKTRHVGAERELASKSAALGVTIEEAKIVKKFLMSLPRKKYIHIVASLEQVLDLNTTSFEDILGRLKAYEERIFEEEETEEGQRKLMYVNYENQTNRQQQDQGNRSEQNSRDYNRGYNRDYNSESYKGRGHRGRDYYRGRGRGRYSERDASQITCFLCDKTGHFAALCPDRLLKLQETHEGDNTETQEADKLMMHEGVFLNEKNVLPEKYETNSGGNNIWYLDNGASNHMTGDRRYFSKLDNTITG